MPPLKPKEAPVATTSAGVHQESTVTVRPNPDAPPKTAIIQQNIPGLPAYLQGEATIEGPVAGLENAVGTGLQIPMLLIAQGNGKAMQEYRRAAGDVYLSTDPSQVVFSPPQTMDFVPFYHYMEYILWAKRSAGGGMLDRSKDAGGNLSILAKQHLARRMRMSPEERQAGNFDECVAYHVFLILGYNGPTLAYDTPIALPLARTKFKAGEQLVRLAKMRAVTLPDGRKAGVPLYGGKYTLGVSSETSKRGSFKYQNFVIQNAGWVDEADVPKVKAAYERARDEFKELALTMEQEESEPADVEGAAKEF